MSKAQLSGAVGYTGFIRPSLQCTQQCSLKPGRHAQEAGSYWPKPLDLGAKTTNLRAGPETSNTAMSAQMSPETYNNHCRQDRAEHNLAARTTPLCSHWKSIGAEAFRLHTPPNGQKPRLYIQTAPVLPRAEDRNTRDLFRSPPHLRSSPCTLTTQGPISSLPRLGRQGAARCLETLMVAYCILNRVFSVQNKMREGSREFLLSKQDNVSRLVAYLSVSFIELSLYPSMRSLLFFLSHSLSFPVYLHLFRRADCYSFLC